MKKFLVLSVLSFVTSASAQTIFNQTFEPSQGFVAGPVTGQLGWSTLSNNGAGNAYVVSPDAGRDNSAGLEYIGGGSAWAWPSGSLTVSGGVYRYSADVFIDPNTPNNTGQYHLDVFASSSVVPYNGGLIGSVAFNPFTHPAGTPFKNSAYVGLYGQWNGSEVPYWFQPYSVPSNGGYGIIPVAAWFNLALEFDFDAGTYRALVDDVDYGITSQIYAWTPGMTLTDFDLYVNQSPQSIARFDNVKLQAVPEPASLLAFGAGLTILRRRRI